MFKGLRPVYLGLSLSALAVGSLLGLQGKEAKEVKEVKEAKPKALPPPLASVPSRIILTWSGNPAHSQAVTWRTETALANPQAQIAKTSADPAFAKAANTVVKGTAAIDDLGGGRTASHYAVNFEGLDADTKYCYRVGDGQVWSEWNLFRTASDKPEAFRFLYMGDAQNDIRSLCSRTFRAAYAKAPEARFIVHTGDLVAEGYDDQLWGEWCDAMGFITATMPSVPVPGNHDLHRAPGQPDSKTVLSVSPLWKHHFLLPENGPDAPELKSQSYYMDYQGVRFIAIDVNVFSNEDFDASLKTQIQQKQLIWLNQVLSTNPNRWTIVLQHQALYSLAKDRNYVEMRAVLGPLFEKYHVDMVLLGHDHCYGRTHKIAAEHIVDPKANGVVYVTSSSGSKMYSFQELHKEMMAVRTENKQCFQLIDVTPKMLKLIAYSVDGGVVDAFELRKSGSGTTLVETLKTMSTAHKVASK